DGCPLAAQAHIGTRKVRARDPLDLGKELAAEFQLAGYRCLRPCFGEQMRALADADGSDEEEHGRLRSALAPRRPAALRRPAVRGGEHVSRRNAGVDQGPPHERARSENPVGGRQLALLLCHRASVTAVRGSDAGPSICFIEDWYRRQAMAVY